MEDRKPRSNRAIKKIIAGRQVKCGLVLVPVQTQVNDSIHIPGHTKRESFSGPVVGNRTGQLSGIEYIIRLGNDKVFVEFSDGSALSKAVKNTTVKAEDTEYWVSKTHSSNLMKQVTSCERYLLTPGVNDEEKKMVAWMPVDLTRDLLTQEPNAKEIMDILEFNK